MFKDFLNTDRQTSAGWWAERKKLQTRKSPEMAEAKGNQTHIAEDAVLCLVTQSCPTLCDPMDCSLPGSSVHGDSPRKNTGVGCHALLQGIFPTRGSNPRLLHCKSILYHLSHQESCQCKLGSPQKDNTKLFKETNFCYILFFWALAYEDSLKILQPLKTFCRTTKHLEEQALD